LSLAYYVGAQIGFAMESPADRHSVLWLPNSILLTALLLLPTSRWALYLAAAFPAQLAIGWQVGPIAAMALLYSTNCVDAVASAAVIRRLSSRAFRFDGLRTMLVFIATATVVTVAVSFADAEIAVLTGFSSDYWLAFATRVRSNPLTHVIVVPTIVAMLSDWRTIVQRREIELLALVVALSITSIGVFSQNGVSGMMQASLYLPLPLLMWAAIRFGPGGTGLGLWLVAFVSSWFAIHGVGPFTITPASESVASLQMFLLALSIPLLVLSAIVQERNHAIATLRASERALRASQELLHRGHARIQELAGRLILAHDAERARIAGDLQDDVNQQLTSLSITLSVLRRRVSDIDDRHVFEDIARLQKEALRVADNVRLLSHDLHPVILQQAGLAAALSVQCDELHQRAGVEVTLTCDPDAAALDGDAMLCLYRVAQEAMDNIAAHASARHAWITFRRQTDDSLELRVVDDGKGFDPAAGTGSGMGLFRIGQRVRLLGGVLSIVSNAKAGTEVLVRLPLKARPAA
jgi:two-component system sensor histidine kinase UhpB